jgi:diguanylate cyclase (GGDEF)-like protein/putative nucleotidyltransferase with HDIG domain
MAPQAPPFRALPLAARALVPTVLAMAAAATAAVTQLAPVPALDPSLLALAAVLCAAAGLFEVMAPGHHSFQPNLVFFFCAAVLLPPWVLPVLALVCFAPGAVVHRVRWYMLVFNAANYLLAGLAAAIIAASSGALAGSGTIGLLDVAALAAASLACVLVNHLLLTLAIAAAQQRTLGQTARSLAGSFPLDLALTATGACLAAFWHQSPALALLAAGPVALVYRALLVPTLRHQSRTDAKTGLFNSEHFNQELAGALALARRRGMPVALVMVDLDHLRAINSRFGHLGGDRAIRLVADVLREGTPERGVAARFGGEEFSLLLPGFSAVAARALADRIRAAVEERALMDDGERIGVTISVGIAAFPEHGETPTALVGSADAALYDAKVGGRNRVRLALSAAAERKLAVALAPAPPERPDDGALPRAAPAVLGLPSATSARGDGASAGAAPLPPASGDGASAGAAPLPPASGDGASAGAAPLPPASRAEEAPGHRAAGRLVAGFVAVLMIAAALVAVLASPDAALASPLLFALLVLSVAALDLVRINLFERANISPASAPALALACFFGPLGPVAAEALIALLRYLRREPTIKWGFDFAALTLAGAAAAHVFDLLSAHGVLALLGIAALAGLAYYAVNVGLLSVVMALAEGDRPGRVWRERLAWLWPHYLLYGLMGGGLVAVEQRVGLPALAIFAMPVVTLWLSQKQYVDRSRAGVAELRRSHDELAEANQRLQRLLDDKWALLQRMQRSYVSTITSLARTIEAKDPYTGGHTERVAKITLLLAAQLGLRDEELKAAEVGAIIHDIGKIGVPDSVLLKPGKLDDDEFAMMRRHPETSSYIVSELDLPPIVKQMARNHHERYDGKGYPDRLVGEEIPLAARILAVADTLDAMTSSRPYRAGLPLATAIDEITTMRGTQFCPRVVDALTACLQRDPTLDGLYDRPQSRASAQRAA